MNQNIKFLHELYFLRTDLHSHVRKKMYNNLTDKLDSKLKDKLFMSENYILDNQLIWRLFKK